MGTPAQVKATWFEGLKSVTVELPPDIAYRPTVKGKVAKYCVVISLNENRKCNKMKSVVCSLDIIQG